MRFRTLSLPGHPRDSALQIGTNFGSKSRVLPYTPKPEGERRSNERSGEPQRIRFYSLDSRTAHHGTMINGSDGGAFIETNETLPLLTRIRIEGNGLSCEAQVCRVHWLRPDERTSRSGGIAVRLMVTPPPRTVNDETESDALSMPLRSALSAT